MKRAQNHFLEHSRSPKRRALASGKIPDCEAESHHAGLYDTLQFASPSSQIRLLFIHPESEQDATNCRLEVFDVENAPAYHAISYVWGSPHPTKTIHVNDVAISIGENCQNALRSAQMHLTSGYIWIDALCIDQSNTAEKSFQVARMYDIYLSASATLACVGIFDGCHEMLRLADTMEPLGEKLYNRLAAGDFCSDEEHRLPLLFRLWHGFCDLPYFSRVWIIQELHAALRGGADCIVFLCGRRQISWRLVLALHRLTLYNAEKDESSFGYLKRLVLSEAVDLEKLIAHSLSFFCKDPRDRIYGCLRMLDSSFRIWPDYEKTEVELAVGLAEHIIAENGSSGALFNLVCIVSMLLSFRTDRICRELQLKQDALPCEALTFPMTFTRVWKTCDSADGRLMLAPLPGETYVAGWSPTPSMHSPGQESLLFSSEDVYAEQSRIGVQSRANLARLVVDTAARPAFLACSGLRSGDFIVEALTMDKRKSLEDLASSLKYLTWFFVLRQGTTGAFEIIGQALCLSDHLWASMAKYLFNHRSNAPSDPACPDIFNAPKHKQMRVECSVQFTTAAALMFLSHVQLGKASGEFLWGVPEHKLEDILPMNLNLDVPHRQPLCETSILEDGSSLLDHKIKSCSRSPSPILPSPDPDIPVPSTKDCFDFGEEADQEVYAGLKRWESPA